MALNSYKIRILYHKRYFDIGYGVTTYLKWLIAILGVTSRNVIWTLIGMLLYGIFCYVFGYFFVKHGWLEAEIEITNQHNRFVKQMRKTKLLNSRTSKK